MRVERRGVEWEGPSLREPGRELEGDRRLEGIRRGVVTDEWGCERAVDRLNWRLPPETITEAPSVFQDHVDKNFRKPRAVPRTSATLRREAQLRQDRPGRARGLCRDRRVH